MKHSFIAIAAIATFALAACGEPDDSPTAAEQTTTPAEEQATEPAAEQDVAAAPAESSAATDLDNGFCVGAGPQTPRDISSTVGTNPVTFALAPPSTEMNLCNIHTHTNAEHKGPGFSVFVSDEEHGGYACNETASLTEAELTDPADGKGAFKAVKPGDTIEVHWVHSSCDISPGEGLGSCLNDACTEPVLRVEAQTFLVVNDPNALDFNEFDYAGSAVDGLHQPKALPQNTGTPVQFLGSTTGPSYTQQKCSPFQVTWNVRSNCAKLDISSLHAWAESGNVFNETKSHGVRQLVTEPSLLAPIE